MSEKIGGGQLKNKRTVLAVIILILFIASFQPIQKTLANNRTVTVLENKTNIREGPGLSYQKTGQVHKEESYLILQEKDDWVQIQLAANKKGWVANWLVSINQTANSPSTFKKGMKLSIDTNGLRVRTGPGTEFQVLDSLAKGEIATVLDISGNWLKIRTKTLDGWVSNQYVKPLAENQTQQPKSVNTGTITATMLYVRNDGSLNGKVVGKVYKGDKFPIIQEVNNWAKIEYKSGSFGWVASWFLEKNTAATSSTGQKSTDSNIEILHNGTNIRKKPNVQADVVKRANQGELFEVVRVENNWYEIRLHNGDTAYVAGWIVSIKGNGQQVEKPGAYTHLKNKTIIVDPGHGGRDNGTTGTRGTLEKALTIQTSLLLSNKLQAAGANVILTRTYDTYLSLNSRVRTSQYHGADAFISIHYDSINDRSVRGTTSFYYHSYQKKLATVLHSSIVQSTKLKNRGARFGDYHVLRENKQKAVLLELGYLSNPAEEALVSTAQYQERAAEGIYQGLARYFKN